MTPRHEWGFLGLTCGDSKHWVILFNGTALLAIQSEVPAMLPDCPRIANSQPDTPRGGCDTVAVKLNWKPTELG